MALLAKSRDQVYRFHAQALRLCGMGEDQPGLRPHYGPNDYAVSVRDADGNTLQAACKAEG